MYTIHADGKMLFSSVSEDVSSIALSPILSLNVNKAGSLSFVLPPGNSMHGNLKKLKSIITVEQDGVQLARGRVVETELDTYNQLSVHCDGEKAFLMDSVFAPASLDPKNIREFFGKLINNHNSQVDAEKQFTVGVVDAVEADAAMQPDSRNETRVYWNTMDMIEDSLLNVYGGYLRTRTVGNTHYIDWVKEYGETNSQPVEFSVNLLDLTDVIDAGDVFTVLIPLGACEIGEDGEYTDPLSIESVNNGLNYIQDDDAVAMYGKIWRTNTWSYIDDPAKLLEKGREYLKTGIALETLTLKAIDMHFTDGNVQPIRIGDRVRILSNPHGLDKVMICSQIEIDLLNPENTLYTFGEKPRTLTENIVKTEDDVGGLTGGGRGGGGRTIKEEISDIIRWAKINVDEANAQIQLTAGELNKTNGNLSAVEIRMDGVEAEIGIAASRLDNVEGRTTSVEMILNGTEATAGIVASVIEQGERISSAELEIDGMASEITMKADKITLDGYVTASKLESELATFEDIFAGRANADYLYVNETVGAQWGNFTNMWLENRRCDWKSKTVVTASKYPQLNRKRLSDLSDSDYVATGYTETMVNNSNAYTTSTMYYLSYE